MYKMIYGYNFFKNIYNSIKYQILNDWYFNYILEDRYYFIFILFYSLAALFLLIYKFFITQNNTINLGVYFLIITNILYVILGIYGTYKNKLSLKDIYEQIINKKETIQTEEKNQVIGNGDLYFLIYIILFLLGLFLYNTSFFFNSLIIGITCITVYLIIKLLYTRFYITNIEAKLYKENKDIEKTLYEGSIIHLKSLFNKNYSIKIQEIKDNKIYKTYLNYKYRHIPLIPILYIFWFLIFLYYIIL